MLHAYPMARTLVRISAWVRRLTGWAWRYGFDTFLLRSGAQLSRKLSFTGCVKITHACAAYALQVGLRKACPVMAGSLPDLLREFLRKVTRVTVAYRVADLRNIQPFIPQKRLCPLHSDRADYVGSGFAGQRLEFAVELAAADR